MTSIECMVLLSCNKSSSYLIYRLPKCRAKARYYKHRDSIEGHRSGLGGRNRLDVENSAEEVLNNISLALLTSLLDAFDLGLDLLVGFGLGLLVALAVLHGCQRSVNVNKPKKVSYLGLELLVFVLLLSLVVRYLLLGFITSFPDALGAVYRSVLDGSVIWIGE